MTSASPQSAAPDGASDTRVEALIARYRPFIREIVRRLCPPDLGLDRHELEQTAVIRLWRIVQSEKEIRDFESYLYRVVARITLDAIREVKARPEEPLVAQHVETLPAFEASPESVVSRRRLMERVKGAVDELPGNRREAVGLHLHGFTHEEVAGMMGWSAAKARSLIYRGLDQLRDKLQKSGIDDPR